MGARRDWHIVRQKPRAQQPRNTRDTQWMRCAALVPATWNRDVIGGRQQVRHNSLARESVRDGGTSGTCGICLTIDMTGSKQTIRKRGSWENHKLRIGTVLVTATVLLSHAIHLTRYPTVRVAVTLLFRANEHSLRVQQAASS